MPTTQAIAFSGKITSYEAYAEACNQAGCRTDVAHDYGHTNSSNFASDLPYSGTYIRFNRNEIAKVWHHHREMLRRVYNVYPERSSTMKMVIQVFRLEPFHINISREDPNMVIFTPSSDDGRADRQVRTTFGKLVRKLCPSLTDDDVRKLEAAHRSETDPVFQVARTVEEIYGVYTGMDGDTGCMRYKSDHFGLDEPGHPSNAYCAPGMGVAYTTEEDGTIKSKAVIWDNPKDASDKRYVRIYGDPVLKVKLERAGYVQSHLEGALLSAHTARRMPDETRDEDDERDEDDVVEAEYNPNRFLMPYLDGPGGSQGDTQGCCVARFPEDNGMFRVISLKVADAIKKALGFGYSGSAKTTEGYVDVVQLDATAFDFTCALSGATFNLLTNPQVVALVYHEGKKQRALRDAAIAAGFLASVKDWNAVASNWESILVVGGDYSTSFYCNHLGRMLDTLDNKRAAGYSELSVELGYTPGQWEQGLIGCPRDGVTLYARKTDTTLVFDATSLTRFYHDSDIAALKKTGNYVAVLPCVNQKYLAHKNCARLVILPSGKRAIQSIHSVKRRYDGVYDLTKNLTATQWFGNPVWISKDLPVADVPDQFVRNILILPALRNAFGDYGDCVTSRGVVDLTRSFVRTVGYGWGGFIGHANSAGDGRGELRQASRWDMPDNWDSALRAAQAIAAMTDEALEAKFWPGAAAITRSWAKVVITMDDAHIAFVALGRPDIYTPSTPVVEVPALADERLALAA